MSPVLSLWEYFFKIILYSFFFRIEYAAESQTKLVLKDEESCQAETHAFIN